MTDPLEFDLRGLREAANRRLLSLRVALGVFGTILILGAMGVTLSRIPYGDEFRFPFYVLDALLRLELKSCYSSSGSSSLGSSTRMVLG